MADYLTVLANDPGKANYAMAILRVPIDDPMNFKIIKTGMVMRVIDDLTCNPRKQARAFRSYMRKIVKKYGVDVIAVERFQNRGRFSGNTGELVSMMIGVMFGLDVLDVLVITAAQWKNEFNRRGDLKQLYKDSKLVTHRIDATSIGLYAAAHYLKQEPFEFLKVKGQDWYRKKLDKTI